MFKVGDCVAFQWNDEVVHGRVREINSDGLFPVRVIVETNTPSWNTDEEASFTVDGRFYEEDEPILKLEATLSSLETPFTIVELNGSRMCYIGGEWVFSNGEVLMRLVYEAVKSKPVEVLFRPEEKG